MANRACSTPASAPQQTSRRGLLAAAAAFPITVVLPAGAEAAVDLRLSRLAQRRDELDDLAAARGLSDDEVAIRWSAVTDVEDQIAALPCRSREDVAVKAALLRRWADEDRMPQSDIATMADTLLAWARGGAA